MIFLETRVFYFEKSVKPPKGLFRHRQSSRLSKSNRSVFDPLVDPRNTVVVASQTPLDPPPTDLCRRPCRVISGLIAIDTPRKPCRDPRRDVDIVVVDAFLSAPHVVKRVLNSVPGGPYILKNRAIYFENICKFKLSPIVSNNLPNLLKRGF